MLKIIRTCLLYLLSIFSSIGHAEPEINCPPALVNPDPEIYKAAVLNAKNHGFLWKISKQGHTSYLYGTIHVGKFDWIFPGPAIQQAVSASDTMALEMDMLDEDIQTRMKKGMETIHANIIPEDLINQLKQQATFECISYETLSKMTPEFQVVTLELLNSRRDQLEASFAIDLVLSGWGHGTKKTMVSLETPEMQLDLMQMKTAQETTAFVADSLAELNSGLSRKVLNHIADIWVKSDYEDLSRYIEWCECMKTESERNFMKRILDDRNPNLADHINSLHESGKQVFAAVGSLHMLGSLGLPALMEKRGYKVERVDFQ